MARRISPRTIATYTTSVEQPAAFLAANGMPARVAVIRREQAISPDSYAREYECVFGVAGASLFTAEGLASLILPEATP